MSVETTAVEAAEAEAAGAEEAEEAEEAEADAAFRAEVRAFLDAHATPKPDRPVHFLALADGRDEDADQRHARECRAWQRTLHEHGWSGITWPVEYGGRGGTSRQLKIFLQEQARYDVATGVFQVAVGMVGPTIMDHGTEAQKARFLPAMLRGDEIWCQLFSEPGAGSDLAGLATRAERDGDEFVVDGQKVWTSGAHYADWGILLARTNWDVPKHRGITYFLVDMRSSGIEVRPLRQINGAAHFNETFLTDVRIPADNVLGEVDGGWAVANTTLAHERSMIGAGTGTGWDDVARHARNSGAGADPCARQELARAYTRYRLVTWMGQRARAASRAGDPALATALGPLTKLFMSSHVSRTGDLVVGVEGPHGMLMYEDAPDNGFWQQNFLMQWSMRIGGGTDQIQRNVIGERVLGLPREPRDDKDKPFRDVPRN